MLIFLSCFLSRLAKDEFHSRLRFVRRGLVAMANSGQHDNKSQFFFTMGMTPELQGKHTIFGKVVGDTLYNMLKLQDVETDEDERPLYPPKIIRSDVCYSFLYSQASHQQDFFLPIPIESYSLNVQVLHCQSCRILLFQRFFYDNVQ